MPDDFNLSSTDTIIKSPALNAPSSQSVSPRRTQANGKLFQPVAKAILDQRQAPLQKEPEETEHGAQSRLPSRS
jgi:hypothetical protein